MEKLQNLDGMTVHTYHYHHIISVGRETAEEIEKSVEISKEWAWQPEAVPPLQRGLWYVPRDDFLARLHRGEMVLPRSVAEWFRRYTPMFTSQKNVNVNVNVNAGGVSDPRALAEIVSREITRRLRAM